VRTPAERHERVLVPLGIPQHCARMSEGREDTVTDADRAGRVSDNLGVESLLPLTDGVVTLRRQHPDDLELHLAAVDPEQMRWLWEPGQRELYEAMTSQERRAHQLRHLHASHDSFGPGPKWSWSVDLADARYVAYVECDLANNHVPVGEANISYVCSPEHRGKGYTSRAVRLACDFLRQRTRAHEAHILVDLENVASLRVAQALGAIEVETFVNEHGRTTVRHVVEL
jgi:RimJ/RimL family protein N-acetyltransferase